MSQENGSIEIREQRKVALISTRGTTSRRLAEKGTADGLLTKSHPIDWKGKDCWAKS